MRTRDRYQAPALPADTLPADTVPADTVRADTVRADTAAGSPAPGTDAGTGATVTSSPDTGTRATATTTPDTGTEATATTTPNVHPARRPGRPRSEHAEQALLDATIEAIGDCGIDGVRCEDVAARAGVGKATLYRRWPGKEDLLIAAFAALKRPIPEPRGESVRDDLIAMLEVVAADADDPRYAQHYALLHAEGERYPRLVALYKERVVEPRLEAMRAVLRRGVANGELRPDLDIEVAVLALTGAVFARGKHESGPAEPCFATRVVNEVLRGFAVFPPLAAGRS
jgi:AcrR family transcriptional regulator